MDWPELPIHEPDDNLDGEFIDDQPRTVLITGASGNIGRKLRQAWEGLYDLVLLDAEAPDDQPEVYQADLAEWDDEWVSLFDGVDAVVHLAALADEFSSWDVLLRSNLDALCHVFHAAALGGVERLIFASSNHAMGGYRARDETPISEDLPPQPGNPYGAAKLFGERLGKSLASAFEMSVVALRLGWVQPGANRPETLPDDWSRRLWLSNGDLVRLFDRSLETDLDYGECVIVNGLSNNRGTRWDLTQAAQRLGYCPEDDAFGDPGGG